MLAVAIQCFVVQPHIDGVYGAPSAAAAHASVQAARPDLNADGGQGVCVICQALATAGSLTLAASPTLTLVERNFVAASPLDPAQAIQRARSHNWQSRAPPTSI